MIKILLTIVVTFVFLALMTGFAALCVFYGVFVLGAVAVIGIGALAYSFVDEVLLGNG